MKAEVARDAIAAGATYVNDVTAFRHDPALAGLVAERGVRLLPHAHARRPATMQVDPRYDDVVSEVKAFLEERAAFAVAEGVARGADRRSTPASASARRSTHNLELLRRLDEIVALGLPVLVGTSRKAFLGAAHRPRGSAERVAATVATNVLALERGASVFRVHDVAADGRCPHGRGCYVARRWRLTATTTTSRTSRTPTTTTRTPSAPQTEVTIEITGLSLYTHHGVSAAEREVGQRLVLDLRLEVGECDATVTDMVEDTVDYGAVCERGRARRPAAQLQDARAPVLGHRRPPARRLRRRGGVGQGDEARAADPAAGRVGVGRGLAPGTLDGRSADRRPPAREAPAEAGRRHRADVAALLDRPQPAACVTSNVLCDAVTIPYPWRSRSSASNHGLIAR